MNRAVIHRRPQGMESKVMIKIFGNVDLRLIISTYYSQNDDEQLLKEAERIEFGLSLGSRP
jgi:hypothetical protein